EGAHVRFTIEGREEPVTVFTTRPDTLFGATFFVVAADAPLAAELVTDEQRAAFEAYVEEVRRASDIERLAADRPKTGVFLGRYGVNPVTGQRSPVWAADYGLADYGTGAIMAGPGGGGRGHAVAPGHRAAGGRPPQDRGVPGPVRRQPRDGAADPGLGSRLRAGRLRHGRDHGRAGRRRARPRVRRRARPADRPHRAAARGLPRGLRGPLHRRRRRHRLRRRRHRPRRDDRPRGDPGDDRPPGAARPRHARGHLPAARLAAVAAAVLGRTDPGRALPGLRRGARPRRPAAGT